ncbi:hypothetical protein K501DRAFT_215177 [Backusella circina FSU 941]|nr:hypothetical protein K501DRAFT_215177 [Backusella circina FSU 941]
MPGHHIHIRANTPVDYSIEQDFPVPLPTYHQQQQQLLTNHSWSEASSVTTSVDSDCSSSSMVDLSDAGSYSYLLHSHLPACDTLFYVNDYHPSVYFQNRTAGGYPVVQQQQQILSQDDHYSPTFVDQTTYPERYPEEFFFPQCNTHHSFSNNKSPPNLVELSKRELIKRVIQLETERYCHTSQEDTPTHPCRWIGCDLYAPTLAVLMAHICEDHVGSGKATYVCEWKDCIRNKKPFLKRHKMYNHMRTHTGERPFICTIPGCKKTFSRPDSLGTHVKTHSNIRPYLCTLPGCQKAYFHSRSLRKHIKSTHMMTSARKRHTEPIQMK